MQMLMGSISQVLLSFYGHCSWPCGLREQPYRLAVYHSFFLYQVYP
jgi:hypothetical protein